MDIHEALKRARRNQPRNSHLIAENEVAFGLFKTSIRLLVTPERSVEQATAELLENQKLKGDGRKLLLRAAIEILDESES